MTLEKQILPLSAVKALRATCKHCNVAIVLPTTVLTVPHVCFNCDSQLPAEYIKAALREIGRLQKEVATPDARSHVDIEVVSE